MKKSIQGCSFLWSNDWHCDLIKMEDGLIAQKIEIAEIFNPLRVHHSYIGVYEHL